MTTPGAAPDERSDSRSPGIEERPRSQETETATSKSAAPVLIVGLGASAGGLRAFEQFFKHMPPESGMAFIVVQHLPPDHKSELPRVLQQHTSMQVCEVEDGKRVEPNCVYVIPPNCQLAITDGRLVLSELASQRGHSAPIDLFLRSLAENQQEKAACVVLSGLGTDGTAGLRAVKEAGGITLAQEPKEAEYDSMPASVIATGLVDFVLPAAQLASKLVELTQGLHRAAQQADAALSRDESAALQSIFAHLRAQTGNDFSQYKRSTVLRRIERRMLVHQVEHISDYLAVLLARSEETNALLRSLLISVTYFFRDRDAFRVLEHQVVPRLFKEKADRAGMRVWVPGCSTGEEAYSIAMLLLDYAAEQGLPADFQIFATDVDEEAIAFGRNGLYSEAIAADVSRKWLERFFMWEGEGYRVRKEVRDKVLFAAHSLIKDPPFSHIDLVSCRNVLIYLNREVQDQVFDVFHYALRPGGYLFLGMSESADRATNLFATVDKKHHIFQRRSVSRRVPRMSSPSMLRIERHDQAPARKGIERRMLSFAEVHHRLLMERYAPPSVIVNESNDVVHIAGDARHFLHITEGEPTQNLLRMVRKDLRIELRTSLHQVRREGGTVQSGVVHLQQDDGVVPVRLYVVPITDPEEASGFIQVIFESLPEEAGVATEVSRPTTVDRLVEQLEDELLRTKESLQATIEDLERSNEELKASNEELLSTNEELQSTAEELETSQEELQSMNEELITVNSELKEKVEEVSRSNSDLQNLIVSTDIGTIFLDRQLRIKRYTSRVTDLFNIAPSDIGRPLAHFTHRIDYDHLLELAERVLKRLTVIEREIRSRDERWYLVRLLPYRTVEERIDGVVITFVDVTERRRAERTLARQQQQISALVENAPDIIARLDRDFQHVYINPAIEKVTGTARQNFLGKSNREMGFPEMIVDRWEAGMQQVFETGREQTMEFAFPTPGGSRHFSARLVPESGPDGAVETVLAIVRDVTDRKNAEDALRESEARFRFMADTAPVMIWVSGTDKKYTYFNRPWLEFTGHSLEHEVGDGWTEGIHPDDAERCFRTFVAAFDAREAFTMEYRLRRHDGAYRWILDNGVPQYAPDGTFTGYIGSCIDIHDRKELEGKLRQRALQQAAVAELGLLALERGSVVELMDIATRRLCDMLDANFCKVLELQPDTNALVLRAGSGWKEGFLGQTIIEAKDDTFAGFVLRQGEPVTVRNVRTDDRFALSRLLQEHDVVSAMGVLIGPPGKSYGVLAVFTTEPAEFSLDDRNFLQAVANLLNDAVERHHAQEALERVNRDLDRRIAERTEALSTANLQLQEQVTQLGEAEKALRESEERWRTLVEQNPDPIVISREARIVYINRAGAEILGAALPDDVIGRSLLDFAPPSVQAAGRERLAAVKRGRATEPMKTTLIRLDGSELLVETSSNPILFEGAPAAQTVIRNLTDRRRSEEIVRRSEERFAKAFRAAPVAMIITRLGSGRIVDVNDHFMQMTGYGREEAVGRKASDMELSIHRIWRDRVGNMLEEGGRYEDLEAQIGSKSGEVHDVLSSGEVIEFGGETCLLSMFYDITARKRLEQEVLEVAESERRRIGQDLHDGLGQQLTGIAFLTKLLEQNLHNVSPDHAGQVHRIVELLSQAISYTRNLSRLLSPVDIQADTLNDALRRLAESTQDYFGLTCRCEATPDLKVPSNRVATHLYRITQEAVNNALKHAGATEIVIELVAVEGQGILCVRDNGRGVSNDPDERPNGMGMRTMRYRSHVIGGTFNVRSGDDAGTVIEVRFPMTD